MMAASIRARKRFDFGADVSARCLTDRYARKVSAKCAHIQIDS